MKNNIDKIIYLLNAFTFDSPDEKPKKEIDEQGDAGGAAASGGGKTPYPAVTKWTSGRKFGPTYNPEQKKWTAGTARGKSNTLL